MPSQYASEPPWWLLLAGPNSYLLRDRTIEEFVEAYESRLEQFLQAMERAERAREGSDGEKPLSCLMRESWATKRFWFNYAARKPFDVEVLFGSCLKEGSAGVESLDEEGRAGLEPFVEKHLKAYDNECAKSLQYAYHHIRCSSTAIRASWPRKLDSTFEQSFDSLYVHLGMILGSGSVICDGFRAKLPYRSTG
ncbi:uncharacterized protein BDZ99DRAFT_518443 [Mytilinidion resinicola]|uniref:Uncharacterized protein n=1 Tax=Mytilinidion resinicola TaxID=574789 RepID=A0A6A6YW58_9PEZI|nr:uncharacterized protein BDZ99DRAFT_518443 [Mytilinidion resinicola]KAF2812623.1 hypothetical protein BDZ99DRAFT_518443 [Mytilinidion resinicola]